MNSDLRKSGRGQDFFRSLYKHYFLFIERIKDKYMLRGRRRLFTHELELEKQQKGFINIDYRSRFRSDCYDCDHIYIFCCRRYGRLIVFTY